MKEILLLHIACARKVDEAAYKKLLKCVASGDIDVCDDVPSGTRSKKALRLANPLGAQAHQVDGADR